MTGTVEKVDGDQVTVRSEDGAEWTWTVDSDAAVRHGGEKNSGTGDLKKGETAFLVGTRCDDDTRTASRVLSGTWEKRQQDRGPGDGRDKFRGPRYWRHWEGRDSGPSENPSKSGAAAS